MITASVNWVRHLLGSWVNPKDQWFALDVLVGALVGALYVISVSKYLPNVTFYVCLFVCLFLMAPRCVSGCIVCYWCF